MSRPSNDSRRDQITILGDSEDLDEHVPLRYSITSYGADYPVDSLVSRLNSDAIYVPKFQRGFVWNMKRASRFIESLLLGLPVPGIFLAREQETQRLIVIDGQQRLKTIRYFYEGMFPGNRPDTMREFRLDLNTPGVTNTFHGSTYKALSEEDRRHLDDSIIHATIIKQDEPSDGQSSVYSIFERLNTGGVSLSPQEIRASIFHGQFSDLLEELNRNVHWRALFGPENRRMRDQELILRFFALYFDRENYSRPMAGFLNAFMDRNRELSSYSENDLIPLFESTVQAIATHIGEKAFRPDSALNAAVVDAVMVGVARRVSLGPVTETRQFEDQYNALLSSADFRDAVTRATADNDRVDARIDRSINAFAEVE